MMRSLLRVWLWLALLGPVAATAGGVFGPDSTARGDAATAQATATAAASSLANLKSGTDAATKLRVGASSDFANYARALSIFSAGDTGTTSPNYVGLLAESTADASYNAFGLAGYASAFATKSAWGVFGSGRVANTADTGHATGVYGSSIQVHAGGDNVGLRATAMNGLNNYALYIEAGGIGQAAATTWTATGGLTVDGGFSYAGKASGASDAAGYVGEIITATGTSAGLTTGTAANATSISVTAGQWIVTSQTYWNTAATTSITKLAASINTTSATHLAAASSVWVGPATVPTATAPLPATGGITRIVNSSGAATYYATCLGVFTVSTLTCTATITAVRIR